MISLKASPRGTFEGIMHPISWPYAGQSNQPAKLKTKTTDGHQNCSISMKRSKKKRKRGKRQNSQDLSLQCNILESCNYHQSITKCILQVPTRRKQISIIRSRIHIIRTMFLPLVHARVLSFQTSARLFTILMHKKVMISIKAQQIVLQKMTIP